MSIQGGGVTWMRVGTGKTRVGLVAADAITNARVIPVIARRAAFDDWRYEIATLQLPYTVMEVEHVPMGASFKEPTIVLVSEGMLLNSAITGVLYSLRESNQIGAFIIDEGYLFKNPSTDKHKSLQQIREGVPSVVLSGSIMTARDLVDIYGQVAISGQGKRLAKGLSHFREQFQTGMNSYGHAEWYPKPGSYNAIMQKIEPFTYIFMPKKSERKIVESILKVHPSKEQLDYLKELKETAAIEGKFELNNMAAIVIKAQQISDGWIQHENGDITFINAPKLERCQALVAEIVGAGERVVVWCAFRADIDRLYPYLRQVAEVAMLQSATPFDLKRWESGKPRICIATEASGSSINHFAQVPYGIYFSQDWKWLSMQQSQGRHDRRSSLHDTCFFSYLHTDKSLDSKVHYTVKASASSERGFINQLDAWQWINA
jgi:hypothetical protein